MDALGIVSADYRAWLYAPSVSHNTTVEAHQPLCPSLAAEP